MSLHLNLTHLKYFFDAARLKNISAAAKENFVSQSAVSQGILKLEQALQVLLTTHQKQEFDLTEQGWIVYEEARHIFQAVKALQMRLEDLNKTISGEVRFVCTNALAQYIVPEIYGRIRQTYPGVKLKFHRGGLNFIHQALRDGEASFAMALDAPEFDAYEKFVLTKGKFKFYRAKAAKGNIKLFVDHHENLEVAYIKDQYLKLYKKPLLIEDALSSWGVVASFVQKGLGVGFLPEFIFSNQETIEEVPVKYPLPMYQICAFKMKSKFLNKASKAVLKLIQQV